MSRYVARRLLGGLGTLLAVVIAAFLLIHLVPGDPARIQLGPQASHASVAALRRTEGLDQPLITQFWMFLRHALTVNFGYSYSQHADVASLIGARIGATIYVVALSLILAVIIAVPAGLYSGLRAGSHVDRSVRNVGQVFYVMPIFWLGLVLSYVFGVVFGVLPTSGYGIGFGGHLESLLLPAITLGLVVAPVYTRILRGSVLTTLDSQFVEAAAARGVPHRRVITHHVLRNSLIPLITTVGLTLGFLVSSSVVIESVFNLPGVGALIVQAVSDRDYPTVQGLVIVFGAAVMIVNLCTDLIYGIVDPRVRL